MAAISGSEKNRRFYVSIGICLALGISLFVVVLLFFTPTSKTPSSNVGVVKDKGVAGRSAAVGGEGSEEYNKNLEKFDEKKANEALQAGSSFIATPVGKPRPVVQKQDTPPPVVATPKPVTQQQVRQPKTDNELLKRTMEDLAALDSKLSGMMGSGKTDFVIKRVEQPLPSGSIQLASTESALAAAGVKPGDLLYAIVETGTNSDVPSAVMATVASGKFRKYRLLGKFQRFEERMVVVFNRMISPEGVETVLESYAVDPTTTEASVASAVDTHFLSRWGGLVAAAFLEGLGEAKRYSGATSATYATGSMGGVVYDTSDQMAWGNYSPSDQAWIALGKVGEKAGKVMEKNFDRPPTVYLHSGTQIGVLILNVKQQR